MEAKAGAWPVRDRALVFHVEPGASPRGSLSRERSLASEGRRVRGARAAHGALSHIFSASEPHPRATARMRFQVGAAARRGLGLGSTSMLHVEHQLLHGSFGREALSTSLFQAVRALERGIWAQSPCSTDPRALGRLAFHMEGELLVLDATAALPQEAETAVATTSKVHPEGWRCEGSRPRKEGAEALPPLTPGKPLRDASAHSEPLLD